METTPAQERIPIAVISDIVNAWLRKYVAENGTNNETSNTYVPNSRQGHLEVLAFHTGVNHKRLSNIKNGRYEIGDKRNGTLRAVDYVPFDIADKIVCGTVGPLAWHTEPLSEYYGPLTVKKYERAFEHEEVAA